MFLFFLVQFCEVGGLAIIHKLGVLMSRLSKVDGIQMSLWGNRFVDIYAKCASMESLTRSHLEMRSLGKLYLANVSCMGMVRKLLHILN